MSDWDIQNYNNNLAPKCKKLEASMNWYLNTYNNKVKWRDYYKSEEWRYGSMCYEGSKVFHYSSLHNKCREECNELWRNYLEKKKEYTVHNDLCWKKHAEGESYLKNVKYQNQQYQNQQYQKKDSLLSKILSKMTVSVKNTCLMISKLTFIQGFFIVFWNNCTQEFNDFEKKHPNIIKFYLILPLLLIIISVIGVIGFIGLFLYGLYQNGMTDDEQTLLVLIVLIFSVIILKMLYYLVPIILEMLYYLVVKIMEMLYYRVRRIDEMLSMLYYREQKNYFQKFHQIISHYLSIIVLTICYLMFLFNFVNNNDELSRCLQDEQDKFSECHINIIFKFFIIFIPCYLAWSYFIFTYAHY